MTIGKVQRNDQTAINGNHEARIRALERAHTQEVYTDDRILSADAAAVVFTGWPSDKTILEITWNAWLVSGASVPAVMYLAFDDDYPVTANDYFWRLSGSVAESTDDTGNDSWGGLALISDYETPTTGRIRLPDFTREATPDSGGQNWLGEADFRPGGSTAPDVWQISGFQDTSSAPISKITLFAKDGLNDDQDFAAGSRFTLTAY